MCYFFVGLSLSSLGAVIFLSSAGFAKPMDDWLLTPRPQRFTELYFTDHYQLPTTANVGAAQKLPFTIHNLEHQDTAYRYQLIAVPEDGSPDLSLGTGTFMLTHNQLQTISPDFVLPAISGRVTIKINLSYEGIPAAGDAPILQTQSIHWRLNITHPPGRHRDS